MDKNKSRTDLLAAGRKKLQQFRQKKDSKGSSSHGKSSKKSSKSEQHESDTETTPVAAKPIVSSLVPVGGTASHVDSDQGIVDSSMSSSMENSLAPEVDVAVDDFSSEPVTPEIGDAEMVLVHEAEPQELAVAERDVGSSVPNGGASSLSIDADVVRKMPSSTSDFSGSPGETRRADVSVFVGALQSHASIDAMEREGSKVEAENLNIEEWEDLLPRQEDVADTSLIQAEEDQVTDEGAMQEADGSCSKQFAETLEETAVEEAASEARQTSNAGDLSASAGFSTFLALPEADRVNPEVRIQQREYIFADSSNEEKSEMFSESGDHGNNKKERFPVDSEDKTVADRYGEVTVSAIGNGCSISFSQLAEVIRGLSEDEYKFLLKSRESFSNAELGNGGLLERLKEELYLTNFTKDIFHLQLTEQSNLQMEFDHQRHQLVSEISTLRASLYAVNERNGCLAEELADCRSKLEAVAGSREEIQDQFHATKAQVEEFSAGAHELRLTLERSQRDLSNLSVEFSEAKGLVATLQVENEKLSGIITSVTGERNKLVEENESSHHENEKLSSALADCKSAVATLQVENNTLNGFIASLTEEKKKLVEEKEYSLHENGKLSSEIADCKSFVSVQQGEISNLSETVALMTEEREMLKEERESVTYENKKVSMELDDCKSLVAALQVENANLSGGLSLVTDERKKLEEEKDYFFRENDRLSSELLVLQEHLSTEHGERVRLEVDLEEVTMRLEQLTEENVFLNSSLDVHKAKMREIDNREAQISTGVAISVEQVQSLQVQFRGHENETDDEHLRQIFGKRDEVSSSVLKQLSDGLGGGPSLELCEQEVFDDSFGFLVLKRHLEEAEKVLENLEKAIEVAHSHSSSLSRSSGKVAAPGISKLIQAFETRVHHEEHEVEERAATEDQSPADPFVDTKEQTRNLRAVVKQLGLAAENASVLFKQVRDGGRSASVTLRELKVHHEALKEHCDYSEATNIELGILYEAAKQHLYLVEAKIIELEVLCDSLKQQEIGLRAENIELGEKLSVYQSRIGEMQRQLDSLQRSSDEMASVMHDQLESLQKEESERVLMVEQEWTSYIAQIIETVGRLDKSALGLSTSTISTGIHDGLDLNNSISASVDAATKVIEDLQEKLEAVCEDHKTVCNKYRELNEKFSDLVGKNELSIGVLHKMHGALRKLVIDLCGSVGKPHMDIQKEELSDPFDYSNYNTLMELLENYLGERLQLQSVNDKLNSELMSIEELNRRCLDSSAIQELIEKVEGVVKLEGAETNSDEIPGSHLESLVSFLVQKYKEAGEQVSLFREELGSKEKELTENQENILQRENEILILRESLRQAEEGLTVAHFELQGKVRELEQSEQRVSSIREKLGIAVAKGKGLVVQRDSLKQSLAEKSSELERFSRELKLKDARLQEIEAKLKTYSEAGERVEALESELSYIRNSATALRESFLLKDSVLQRIEEILEDLDLPEHFHSRDIIEKVDWLARSTIGNSLPPTDWDQKSSVGGSYSDAGFVVMDAWKEDVQPSSNSGDDLRRKYEELQGKFYGLAEQNEMLEQSLMERNYVVQRWEELLDRINMPSQLRSMEPEHKIEWLGSALSEANHDRDSLEQKIDNLENYCGSLTADLEVSEKKISDVEVDLQSVVLDRERLSKKLEILTFDHEKLSARALQFELENEKLQNEVNSLQEKLVENLESVECLQSIEDEIFRLQGLVSRALKDAGIKDLVSAGSSTECLEGLLRKLIEDYKTLASLKLISGNTVDGHGTEAILANPNNLQSREVLVTEEPVVDAHGTEVADANLDEATSRDALVTEEPDIASLKKDLEEALRDLKLVKEERDRFLEKQQSLVSDVEALDNEKEELQELLNQEEQKSASVREKLNVAVRKGKSLVQQRDSLKQTIDEMNTELERLKSEISHRGNALAEYEQKIGELSSYRERAEVLESECLFLRNSLTETEHFLQERGQTLSMILNTLGDIDVGDNGNVSNPVEKLQKIGKLFCDFHAAVASSEQESRKSRRAAELLLAELNEVQERNDGLQEDLTKFSSELQELSKQRDAAEVSKLEALSRLEKLSMVHSEEKRKQYSDIMVLKTSVDQVRNCFSEVNNFLADVFSKDLEFLQSFEANVKSRMKQSDVTNLADMPLFSASVGITSSNSVNKENFMPVNSWSDICLRENSNDNDIIEICSSLGQNLHEFITDIGALKEKVHIHLISMHEQVNSLSKVIGIFPREMASQRESFGALKRDMMHIESIGKEKDIEIVVLRKNIALLYEACTTSVAEIENKKAELVGNNLVHRDVGMNFNLTLADDGISLGGDDRFSSKEFIKSIADRLLLAVKECASMNAEIVEGNQKEMKITIANLQKELQEKDIQKDRICMELVSQIKQAEATARSYSLDLQSSNAQMHDLEKRLEAMVGERNLLEQRVKELQDGQASCAELQERVRSLTDVLAAKEQEIEALMQALDEEEVQMEDLMKKIRELEKVVRQKNLDLENLEASRGKVAKKLSVTVSKFDELHHLSESLLAEVEKLQMQLQDRDAEISFLRQEVTRCTNEVLVASQMSNKRDSDEIYEFLSWFNTISRAGLQDVPLDDRSVQVHEYKELLQKKITSIISELEDLRGVAQSRHSLLEAERRKVEELTQREETLEKFLREKESRINMLEGVGDLDQATGVTSEILEVEPVINKWAVSGTSIPSQVRSLRKVNNDQVAIAIDADPGDNSSSLEEDDDKAHGFKSLTTSRIVPRFTRPVTDMIDGLWVTCDRTLMRQPVLRLGIIIYWAVMHVLLTAFVV